MSWLDRTLDSLLELVFPWNRGFSARPRYLLTVRRPASLLSIFVRPPARDILTSSRTHKPLITHKYTFWLIAHVVCVLQINNFVVIDTPLTRPGKTLLHAHTSQPIEHVQVLRELNRAWEAGYLRAQWLPHATDRPEMPRSRVPTLIARPHAP